MWTISLVRSLWANDAVTHAAAMARLRHARISVSLVFFANGFVVASWLPHIPEVKERLALSDFWLGIALFAMAAGSVLVLNLGALMLALLLFGTANGMLDVAMNAQAVLVEDRYRRPILSSLHGL